MMMLKWCRPIERAPSTYSSVFTASTWPRVGRTKTGVAESPMAIIALVRLGPRKAASAIAVMREGHRQESFGDARDDLVDPAAVIAGDKTEGYADRHRDGDEKDACHQRCLRPQIIRERMSRPISSVPSQCAADGALRIADQLVATGSGSGNTGARMASAAKKG